jgi:hypothetical protein
MILSTMTLAQRLAWLAKRSEENKLVKNLGKANQHPYRDALLASEESSARYVMEGVYKIGDELKRTADAFATASTGLIDAAIIGGEQGGFVAWATLVRQQHLATLVDRYVDLVSAHEIGGKDIVNVNKAYSLWFDSRHEFDLKGIRAEAPLLGYGLLLPKFHPDRELINRCEIDHAVKRQHDKWRSSSPSFTKKDKSSVSRRLTGAGTSQHPAPTGGKSDDVLKILFHTVKTECSATDEVPASPIFSPIFSPVNETTPATGTQPATVYEGLRPVSINPTFTLAQSVSVNDDLEVQVFGKTTHSGYHEF